MLKLVTRSLALLGIGTLIAGCSGPIKVTDSWNDPNREDQRVPSIMVLGLAEEANLRRLYEDNFVEELQARGVNAMVSYRTLDGELTDKMVDDAMADAGMASILVTRMVDETREELVIRPGVPTPGTDTSIFGGYASWYIRSERPPFDESEWVTYFLESNLYDHATEGVIWAARTSVEEPITVEDAVDGAIKALTSNMQKHGIIGK